MTINFRPLLCTPLAALLLSTAARAEDAAPAAKPSAYQVNLSPAWKVGQKFGMIADFITSTRTTTTQNAPSLPAPLSKEEKQDKVLHFDADGEVLAVRPNGDPQKVALEVRMLMAMINNQPLAGLPAQGTKIVAERTDDGKNIITIDGQPPSKQLSALLDTIIWVNSGKHTDQEDFGPANAMAVGATWPVNAPNVMADAKETFDQVSAAKGEMKLVSVKGEGEDQVCAVAGNFTLDGLQSPIPPPFTGPAVEFQTTLTGSFPIVAKGTLRQTQTMNLKASGEATNPTYKSVVKIIITTTGKDTHQITFR